MNKFLNIALVSLSVLVSIMLGGSAVAAVEYVLHLIVPPPALTDFESLSFAEKTMVIDNYLNSSRFAFPSAVIGHATAPFVSILSLVSVVRLINRKLEAKIKAWHFALPLVCFWISVVYVMDLAVIPVGPMLASIDAGFSLFVGITAFIIAGGLRKHEGPASVTSEEEVYRG